MEDVDRILLFRDVVEAGGFAAAAARRGMAHSTVSRQVRALEDRFGVPLMTRTTRTRQLTPAGVLVLAHARRIGVQLDELLAELERLEELVSGELRVHSLVHVGAVLVLPAVERFAAEHPAVDVFLTLSDEPLAFSRAGLDVALTVGLPPAAELVARKLCDNAVCLVAAPSLLEGRPLPEHPTDLLRWPIVAYHSGTVEVTRWPYVDQGRVRTLSVRPRMTVNDGVSLLDLVRRGLGVGYLSCFSVMEDLRRGTLVQILPEVQLPPYAPIYVVHADRRLVSARVQQFVRCLRATVQEVIR
ncbi:MAG: LysR family transcriptional regulator [Myxococcales bacterium]|nr:LysR family transcriptional regulator [Myxococcales bacterium]